jgi:hypothetical protein
VAGPAVVAKGDDVVSAWRRKNDVFLVVGAGEERDLGEGTEPQPTTSMLPTATTAPPNQ